jgi:TRAP transporter TatT component family protein
MLRRSLVCLVLSLSTLTACDMGKIAVGTTAKILAKAQPSLEQESDYEMAARAIPGTLKTIEGFHYYDPENETLTKLLAQGYCQYSTGFIEDEWERAEIAHDDEAQEYDAERATKANVRCMGYALEILGGDWKKALDGDLATFQAKVAAADGDRDAMMWLAIGLAGMINFNRDDIELVAHLPKAKALIERVVQLDDASNNGNLAMRALPHVVLGMIHSALGKSLGGDLDRAKAEFQRAIEITQGKFLLAKVLYARRWAVAAQDRAEFHKTLIEVLQTDPAIWPDQRLANEIAHRRAKRYLKREKEWF